MSGGVRTNDFMLNLANELMENRGITESSANQYIQSLYSLHNKSVFNNLAWLKNTADVEARLATFAPTTQRGYLSAIVSVLTPYKDKSSYKKTYQHYYDAMMKGSKEARENKVDGAKTKKQEENWTEWAEVIKKRDELRKEVLGFANRKTITPAEYELLLRYVILSLYTDIQPRRNQDFMDMTIVKKYEDSLPKDMNYLDNSKTPSQFIFNKYKTAKKYGEQRVSIPNTAEAPLGDALLMYFKHHPLLTAKSKEVRFLVNYDGSPLSSVNAITRCLNKIFKKKIGSSQLRHIFITSKYGDLKKEMATDAEAMGHSVSEQQNVYNVPH